MDFSHKATRIVVFILSSLLFPLIFVSLSFSSDLGLRSKNPAAGGLKESDVYERARNSGKKLVEAVEKGEDITGHLNRVFNDIAAIEAQDRGIQQRFQETEEKLKTLGLSKALMRHRDALSEYTQRAREQKSYIDPIRAARRQQAHPEEIKRKVKDLVDFIERSRPQEKAHLKSSDSGLPWKVVDPGDIVLLGDSSTIPQGGSPPASPGPPTSSDLSETKDVQITPEIQALAQSLDNNPLKIFRYVYNNYDHTPYYGSMKGSLDTYWEKEGNDYDLASLLISLLRASNIPARYVRATVLLPMEKVQKWTGINDPMTALQYLSSAQIPLGYYVQVGGISDVQIEHVYVEAYVPYANYRGTSEDPSGKLWIPLDPSIKNYKVTQEGFDIATDMGFDWKTFSSQYLGEIRNVTPIDFYQGKVNDFISGNYQGQTIDTLKRKTEISGMLFDFLPNTLPYTVVAIKERFSEIPQTLRHTLRFTIPNSLDFSVSLPEVSGKRLTLSFEGATADDQAVIDSYGNIFKTPPYLVEIKPVMRINGSRVAEGTAVNAGISAPFTVTYTQTNGKMEVLDHSILTGSFNAVGITTGKVRPEFLTISEVEASEEPYISKMLHSLVMKYQNEGNVTKQILNDTMKMKSKTFFSEALVSSREDINRAYDIPLSFDLSGFEIDAKEIALSPIPVDGYSTKKVIDFAMVSGHEASYQENAVFENSMFWLNGLSAVKGLQVLETMGINVTELTPPLTYSNANLPDIVVTDINNALNMGWNVIVPDDTGGLPAIPYIKYDPKTGSAGYMIATTAGGSAGYMDINVQLLDLISVNITWEPLWRQPIGIEFEVLDPEDGITVAAGDTLELLIRMTVRWKESTGEEWTEIVDDPNNIMTIKTGPWTSLRAGSPPWFIPGSYNILYDGRKIFSFKVWGVRIDSFASGNSLIITTQDGRTTISDPIAILYYIADFADVELNSVKMVITGNTETIIRDLPKNMGDNQTMWDGTDSNGKIVPLGEYRISIQAQGSIGTVISNEHKVMVIIRPCCRFTGGGSISVVPVVGFSIGDSAFICTDEKGDTIGGYVTFLCSCLGIELSAEATFGPIYCCSDRLQKLIGVGSSYSIISAGGGVSVSYTLGCGGYGGIGGGGGPGKGVSYCNCNIQQADTF